MIYALISNNVVINTIVADQDFIDSISKNYDTIVSFKEDESHPSPGYTYDGKNFSPPVDTSQQPDPQSISQQIDSLLQQINVLSQITPQTPDIVQQIDSLFQQINTLSQTPPAS